MSTMTSMTELVHYRNLVAGRSLSSGTGEAMESFDPATGRPGAMIPRCDADDVDAAVAAARTAFKSAEWRGLTASARGRLISKLADEIEAEAPRLAAIETRDNGKLIAEMNAQLSYLPAYFRY